MKKNIISSILEAIGFTIISFVSKLHYTCTYFVWWVYLIMVFVLFIAFFLINLSIDVYFSKRIKS